MTNTIFLLGGARSGDHRAATAFAIAGSTNSLGSSSKYPRRTPELDNALRTGFPYDRQDGLQPLVV